MRIGELKRKARMAFRSYFELTLVVAWLGFLSQQLPSVRFQYSQGTYSYLGSMDNPIITWDLSSLNAPWLQVVGIISGLGALAILLIWLLVPLGIRWFYLDVYDQASPPLRTLVAPFKQGWKLIGATLLVGIFTLLWSLLFVLPGIIKSISYSQTFFILKENPDLPVLDAITESRHLMRGRKGEYVMTKLSFIGWYIPLIFPVTWLNMNAGNLFDFPMGVLGTGNILSTEWVQFPYLLWNYHTGNPIAFVVLLLYLLFLSVVITPYMELALAGFYRESKEERRIA